MQLALHACLLALVPANISPQSYHCKCTGVALCIFQEVQVSKHTGYVLQVVPCLALHDTMRHIKSDVVTVGFGGCMGMSGFLLAVGKKVCCFVLFLNQKHCHEAVSPSGALWRYICVTSLGPDMCT